MLELLANRALSGLIVMGILGTGAYKAGFVDISGLVSAFAIGFLVWYTGGPAAFTLLLFFFFSAGVATKFKYKAKAKKGLAQESKGRRSWKNVIGSGIIPLIFSIGMFFAPTQELQYWMFGGFIGSVATTTSDTLASEIGVFSKKKPRLITHLRRKVPAGTIGAVSLLGEGVALAAGVIIGVIVLIFAVFTPGMVPIATSEQFMFIMPLAILTGFIGCNMDSLFGAVFQNRFVCEICGAITDKEFHCGYETKYIGGFKRFTNMHVNLGSSGMGATLGIILGAGLFVWILGALFFWMLASSSN